VGVAGRGFGVVVITGASAGVGRATARAFARCGASVALLARGEDGLRAAAGEVLADGGRTLVVPVDVADWRAVEAAADRVEAELGPIDVWVNNAMATIFAPFQEITPEEFERATAVTYLGAVNGTRAALRRMTPRGRGRILNVGSALAYRGIPLQSAYSGAKHAIQGLHDSLRAELLHDGSGVSIGMVQLPALNTPQFRTQRSKMPRKPQPMPPLYQPEVAANAIVWMAASTRGEIYVTPMAAATILADKLAPRLLDHYLARRGYDGQQTAEPAEPRPDNLDAPLPGDHGAHGPFDDQARTRDRSAVVLRRPGATLAGVTGALVFAAALLGRRSRR
jgi:NAD(P)-dependent dehydrogenase (short-subunit alcohol dehydrogenase family)